MEAVLIVLLLAGFIGVLSGIVLVGSHGRPRISFATLPMQSYGIPFRRRAVLFSGAERSFYNELRALVPDHMILMKVKLADLVSLPPRKSFWEHFSPINRKHIDFVVCDATLAPILAIELDAAPDAQPTRSNSDLISSVLANASLPIVHVPHRRRYLFSELRRLLAPYLMVPRPLL